MKKSLTLLSVIIILLTFTTSKALANDVISSVEERVVVSVLVKPVDRKTINELELNEMQYIRLKNLSKQYQKDLAALSSTSSINEPIEVNLQQLNVRYFTELNSVLSEKQIAAFVLQNTVANVR